MEETGKEVKIESSSEVTSARREYLIQYGGILCIAIGVFLSTVGVYKAVGGTGTLIMPILGFEIDQVLGLVFTIVGVVALAGGILLCYAGFNLERLKVACVILGSSCLIIPSMLVGIGYFSAAAIVAIVLGYAWLATLFLWLKD